LRVCGGAATPALAGSLDAPELAWLTDRELEVARLAARGLTRADIASRLFLSARTVANHLNHIYGKLGLSNRGDLAALLGEGDSSVGE
jgi:DNA-binding CsgD family transcriptional regulator